MKIRLDNLSIDTVDLGSQGSAILGIRDSGKTYTATWFAERLFEAGIPFVTFDPIGVWRYLRVPGAGKGYPVVVAGGTDGDLPLTVTNAPEIVRAAMAGGISLVIDLFDMKLSKADWKRIVTACVRVLLHENAKHGLRHVFIEEAAEFAPQRVGPDQGQVYAEIEKLARMGGNSRLGYTLINQRAEEVNKAVLELCDNLFLHRQKGRNSLTALSKWLDIGNVAAAKDIIATLSTLPTGECWAWPAGTEQPTRVKVPPKSSLHPDRRVMRGEVKTATKAVNVSTFVETMKTTLVSIEEEARANDPAALRKEIADLKRQLAAGVAPVDPKDIKVAEARGYDRGFVDGMVKGEDDTLARVKRVLASVLENEILARPIAGSPSEARHRAAASASSAGSNPAPAAFKVVDHLKREGTIAPKTKASDDPTLTPAKRKILIALRELEAIGQTAPDKMNVAWFADASPKSSAYANNLGALRSAGLIEYPGQGTVALTAAGRELEPARPAPTHAGIMELVRSKLTPALMRMLEAAATIYPDSIGLNGLAASIDASPTSSAFANNKGRLRSLGLIEYPAAGMVRAADLLFPGGR